MIWLVFWAHPYFERKSSFSKSLHFSANYNRICTGWEHSMLKDVQNVSNSIQCLVAPKCTYFCNHEHRRVQPNDLSIIESTKWVKFHNQYNIESCSFSHSNCSNKYCLNLLRFSWLNSFTSLVVLITCAKFERSIICIWPGFCTKLVSD